jgi:hypothetical protein
VAPQPPNRSLQDLVALFPSAAQLPAGVVLAEQGTRTAAEIAATFPDPADAAQVLETWGWALNAYRVYVAGPTAGPSTPSRLEISLHQFSMNATVGCATCGASYALSYFAHGRAVMLHQVERLALGMGPCDAEIASANGNEVTRYLRDGNLLIRVTAAMTNAPAANAYYLALAAATSTAISVVNNAGTTAYELDQTCQ